MSLSKVRRALASRAGGVPFLPVIRVATGAAANTDITVTDLKRGDVITSVVRIAAPTSSDAAGLVDKSSEATVQANGKLRLTSDSTGYQLLVAYLSK